MVTPKLPMLTTVLNLVVGLSIFIALLQKLISTHHHIIEAREIIVLGELIVIACAVYSIVFKLWNAWLKIFQYIFLILFICADIVTYLYAYV